MKDVLCASCGETFQAQSPRAKYCGATCRKRGSRAGSVATLPRSSEPSATTLVEVVRRDLEQADRLETIEGQQAVLLAQRMVSAGSTSSGVATLNKELNAVLGRALAGTKPRETDALDELERRRMQKAAGA